MLKTFIGSSLGTEFFSSPLSNISVKKIVQRLVVEKHQSIIRFGPIGSNPVAFIIKANTIIIYDVGVVISTQQILA